MPNLALIGAGAIGTALAFKFQRLNYGIALLGRHGPVEKYVKIVEGETSSPFGLEDHKLNLRSCGLVFVTVKAYDLEAALRSYIKQFSSDAIFVAVCNGQVESILAKFRHEFKTQHWRLGSIDIGVREDHDGSLVISNAQGKLRWGSPWGDGPSNLEREIASQDPFFQWRDDILDVVRCKWLFNTVINSLAASMGLATNGPLLNCEDKVNETFAEAFHLGEELWGQWPESSEVLLLKTKELIKATKNNENSMVRDLRLGRKTESAFLAGLAMGRKDYPHLQALHRSLIPSTPSF